MIGKVAQIVLLSSTLVACTNDREIAAGADNAPKSQGQLVFEEHCIACHGSEIGNPGEPFMPGTGALDAKYDGTLPAVLTERTDLTPTVVAYFVRNGAGMMPFFRKTDIDDDELAALGLYLSNTEEEQ